jgi:peptidyl-prolyl cis-trans isomerase A (cyclophilin A)
MARLLAAARAAVTVAAVFLLLGSEVGHAEKRVALVLGNAAYRHLPQLNNPRNDAEDVSRSLRGLGFETIVATDLDRGGMNAALGRFSRAVEQADIAIVYYSGHGMQFAGSNYLLPVEAKLESASDVNRFQLMPADEIVEAMRPATGARLLILDACRNNPVEDDLKRRLASVPGANRSAVLTRGFARISAGDGLIIAYATQANDVANDGTARNSPFTTAFLKHVATPDMDLRQMLFRVQDDVNRVTGGRQRPELSISLVGEFKLKAAGATPTSAAASTAVATAATSAPANTQIALGQGKLADPTTLNEKAPASFKVRFETSQGAFVVQVDRDWAPNGADRFYNLVKNGFYNDVRFFRVISNFMAQFGINGDPKLSPAWRTARIPDDPVRQSNKRGNITFATSGPNSRTTQLFINFRDNAGLDGQGFAPFGQVVSGMDVVDKLYSGYGEGAPSGRGPEQGRIQGEGNAYLTKEFPQLDYIRKASIEP